MAAYDITPELLNGFLKYDPETGVFTRLVACKKALIGKPAGYTDRLGYVRIRLRDGKIHKAHRLAWLVTFGENPNCDIDHIDGNPSNNRIENLRKATRSENRQNIRKAHSKNSHGYFGVSKRRNGRWQVRITVGKVAHHIGTFMTAEAAQDAYVSAKRRLHPFCEI